MKASPCFYTPQNVRKILCVFPKYSRAFGTFYYAYRLIGGVKAFMPPQGLLLVAALLPREWEVRFIDENIREASTADFLWCDAVFLTGMHIQREQINVLALRAKQLGKCTVLGGPSVSAAPEFYPSVDVLHLGEAGDGTLRLFQWIDLELSIPAKQLNFQTSDRLPMEDFPVPAYSLVNLRQYMLASVQFSSGCPYQCEFCDIPGLYGKKPRIKSPEQIIKELDILADAGAATVYFVDDNFIANPAATRKLLSRLVPWQKKRDYSVRFSCEATLNISGHTDILEMMQDAYFTNIFCGIETPEVNALKAMNKKQNLRSPILDSIDKIYDHGIGVSAGLIIGFDTDNDDTPRAICDFVEQAHIPILAINLLYALPRTALYDRLSAEGRIVDDTNRDTNIKFLLPYEEVRARWQTVVDEIYRPERLYERYRYFINHVSPSRRRPVDPLKQLTFSNVRRALGMLARIVWNVGILSNYRREFWTMALPELRKGHIENVFQVAMVSHHLITYARECTHGKAVSSNYSLRVSREADDETKRCATHGDNESKPVQRSST